jgi:hypothetical protein
VAKLVSSLVSRQSLGLAPKLPFSQLELVVETLDGYGGRIPWGSDDVVQSPGRCSAGGVCEAEQGWRDAGTERYVEAVKGNREACAEGLQVSFFPRPALEEGFYSRGGGQGFERRYFGGRKEAGCDISSGAFRIYKLNIRAYARMPGESEKSEVAGVGKIELERRLPEVWGQPRLTLGSVGKREFPGRGAEILRQNISHGRAGSDKTKAVAVKMEAVGALDLVLGERAEVRRVSIILAG